MLMRNNLCQKMHVVLNIIARPVAGRASGAGCGPVLLVKLVWSGPKLPGPSARAVWDRFRSVHISPEPASEGPRKPGPGTGSIVEQPEVPGIRILPIVPFWALVP